MDYNPLYKFVSEEERRDIKESVNKILNEDSTKNKIKIVKSTAKNQIIITFILFIYICLCGYGVLQFNDIVYVLGMLILFIVTAWGLIKMHI